jgi:predicted lipoprotein with Yx(FWY)xxD motif
MRNNKLNKKKSNLDNITYIIPDSLICTDKQHSIKKEHIKMKTKSITTSFKKQAWLIGLLLTVSAILAACQSAAALSQAPATQMVITSNPTDAPPALAGSTIDSGAALSIATDPKLGQILVDGKGLTLYMFIKDEPDKSNCVGGCLVKWPPLLTQGSPLLGEGLDPALVGTATLAAGSKFVTYNKMPFYFLKSSSL